MALLVILIIFLFPEISLKTLKNEQFFQVYLPDAIESDYEIKSRFINFQFVYIVL